MADKRCPARITDYTGFNTYACGKKASTEAGFCRTHDPELCRQRRLARGPTAWEREMAAKKAERERLEGIEADNAALRARIALLERVREAAEDYVDCINKFGTSTHTVRSALRAALDAAKEEP